MSSITCSKTKKTEDIVMYRKQYSEEHKEELKQVEICDICGGSYQLWNRSAHNKTKRHKYAIEKIESEKVRQEFDKLKNNKENQVIKKELLELKEKIEKIEKLI